MIIFDIEEKRPRVIFFFESKSQGQTRAPNAKVHQTTPHVLHNTPTTGYLLLLGFVVFLGFCFCFVFVLFFGLERTDENTCTCGLTHTRLGEDKRCRFWRGRFWAHFSRFGTDVTNVVSCHQSGCDIFACISLPGKSHPGLLTMAPTRTAWQYWHTLVGLK